MCVILVLLVLSGYFELFESWSVYLCLHRCFCHPPTIHPQHVFVLRDFQQNLWFKKRSNILTVTQQMQIEP